MLPLIPSYAIRHAGLLSWTLPPQKFPHPVPGPMLDNVNVNVLDALQKVHSYTLFTQNSGCNQ
jgi:hypothetical protein